MVPCRDNLARSTGKIKVVTLPYPSSYGVLKMTLGDELDALSVNRVMRGIILDFSHVMTIGPVEYREIQGFVECLKLLGIGCALCGFTISVSAALAKSGKHFSNIPVAANLEQATELFA